MKNYFAYGSNMNWDDLDKWCNTRGYPPIHPGTDTEKGVIKNYRLIFNHFSKSRNGGALNIIKSRNTDVCGVLFNLSDEDFEKIIRKGGPAYEQHAVNVILSDGRVVGAKTFKATSEKKLYPPTSEYLEVVTIGANDFDLGDEYIDHINRAAQEARR